MLPNKHTICKFLNNTYCKLLIDWCRNLRLKRLNTKCLSPTGLVCYWEMFAVKCELLPTSSFKKTTRASRELLMFHTAWSVKHNRLNEKCVQYNTQPEPFDTCTDSKSFKSLCFKESKMFMKNLCFCTNWNVTLLITFCTNRGQTRLSQNLSVCQRTIPWGG